MMWANIPTAYSLLAFTTLISAHPLASSHLSSTVVDLGYTSYQGGILANGITQWLGMRYAAPPVGDLRFRAPRDPIADGATHIADTVRSHAAHKGHK